MTNHYLNGLLLLDENDTSRMNYLIENLSTKEQTSITDLLDTIYNSTNTIKKLVRVMGRIYNNGHTFLGFESLHISKDRTGVHSYHIGNFPVELQLFELAEKNTMLELVIEDYTDSTKNMVTTCITEDVNYDNSRVS